jgi:glycosyltransferase involved in cell wall biosynthesis
MKEKKGTRTPRVLVVALGRINAADTANNGLLLRNIFGGWPRENLAQIYSSGDNGDDGFFGRYYQLGATDRRLGKFFYRMKAEALAENDTNNAGELQVAGVSTPAKSFSIKSSLKRYVVDSGIYEMIFYPCISKSMIAWIQDFQPDIIFAQGYRLTFAWLPVRLAKRLRLPLSYYPTDDWPNYEYRSGNGGIPLLSRLIHHSVAASACRLVEASTVRLAFNRYMQEEYRNRYKSEFTVLMHGDDLSRYQSVKLRRNVSPEVCWIVATGVFNEYRLPLLRDLDDACDLLNKKGLHVRTTVFPVNKISDATEFRYINIEPCPSHDELVPILKGADILFLLERFDEKASGIHLSVSSKAHLFMFSERPIIVYSDPVTGITRYATEEGWAAVVDRRDPKLLAEVIEKLITDESYRRELISSAQSTAGKNHDLETIRASFRQLMCNAVFCPEQSGE